MKFRKKPVVIEAFKFYHEPMPDWFMDKVSSNEIILRNCDYNRYSADEAYCRINTLEGVMEGRGGDYIIKGVQGEIYPCKPDIFEKTYGVCNCEEVVEESYLNHEPKEDYENNKLVDPAIPCDPSYSEQENIYQLFEFMRVLDKADDFDLRELVKKKIKQKLNL